MKENYSLKNLIAITAICILSISCSKEQSFEQVRNGNVTISMKEVPEITRIVQGSTVTWVNDDNQVHTVINDNLNFNSGDMQNGARFSVTFNEPGNYNYRCLHHPGMSSILVLTH